MAAFDSPQPSRFSISDCSICLDAYHPQERIPRMLKSCGHTFCEPCLVKLRLSTSPSPVVKCPSCRKETKVEDKDPFPKNYALLETIEQAQRFSVQHQAVVNAKKCDRCSTQPAEFGCGICVVNLCGICWGDTHNYGLFFLTSSSIAPKLSKSLVPIILQILPLSSVSKKLVLRMEAPSAYSVKGQLFTKAT